MDQVTIHDTDARLPRQYVFGTSFLCHCKPQNMENGQLRAALACVELLQL